MDGKECDVDTYQCVPLTCKETTSKIGGLIKAQEGSSKWFVGDTAEFCCEEGIYMTANLITLNLKLSR